LDAPDAYIPPALPTLVDNAVYASRDASDGVEDHPIQNPSTCAFNPESLLCRGGNTVNCLTPHQATP